MFIIHIHSNNKCHDIIIDMLELDGKKANPHTQSFRPLPFCDTNIVYENFRNIKYHFSDKLSFMYFIKQVIRFMQLKVIQF